MLRNANSFTYSYTQYVITGWASTLHENESQKAYLANANVSGGDATDSLLILVKYNLAGGKSRIDLDAHLLGNTAQPPAQLPQTDDIIAIIVKLRRQEEVGNGIAGIFRQYEELVFRYGRGMRRLCILEGRRPIVSNVRKQLPERLGVEHIAREDVGANFAIWWKALLLRVA